MPKQHDINESAKEKRLRKHNFDYDAFVGMFTLIVMLAIVAAGIIAGGLQWGWTIMIVIVGVIVAVLGVCLFSAYYL